jgi:Peptidase family M1 domain
MLDLVGRSGHSERVSRPRRIRLVAAAVAIALAGCSSSGDLIDDTPSTEPSSDRPAPGPPEAAMERAAPWPDRPVVDLRFDASGGLETIRGTERVRFIAEERVCRLVFRLWANKPALVEAGTELTVDRVQVRSRPVRPTFRAAGAPGSTPGSLMTVPIRCLDPGRSIRVTLDFHFTLGPDVRERMGRSDDIAWFATAFPLLAWQRDRGWATNPVVPQFGEMVSSEEFRLRRLDVVVPESYEVLGTGQSLGRRTGPRTGTTVERFRAESVRDVAVTVGELDVVHRDIGDVRLHIGAPVTGTSMSLEDWAGNQADAITALEEFLGDFPYSDLWVSVLPDGPGGIEFPGAIQYGDADAADPFTAHVIVHETAHMWFYGLVGNNQGTDPWLDESWATYAEERVAGASPFDVAIPDAVENHVGESMVWYSRPDTFGGYGPGVYIQGGEMLREAMGSIDDDVADALLQGYVNANAHAIATPSDVADAFSSEPSFVEVLREYGAVD